jgi:cell division protease FtsH
MVSLGRVTPRMPNRGDGQPEASAPRESDASQAPGQRPPRPTMPRRTLTWFLLALLVNFLVVRYLFPSKDAPVTVPYTLFRDQVTRRNVAAIYSRGERITGHFRTPITYPATTDSSQSVPSKKVTSFATTLPSFVDQGFESLLITNGVEISAQPIDEGGNPLSTFLAAFGPALLIIGFYVWIFRRAAKRGGGMGGMLGIGQSKARRFDVTNQPRVTFDDVAGIDEAENELVEVVDFLKDPRKYTRLGGAAPKGVLLVGAPGTGKTLLAKAVAGEAGVPFFSMAGSEFVEMIVGVGAARVRDLFKQAREHAPAIIFIDELDSIGRARGQTVIGGSSEQEQTLNQILTEMDGFEGNEGVVVLAATNRAEVLDPALLRPGRFDRRVVVSPPDLTGRLEILQVHVRQVPLAPDVDLAGIAAATPGLVGADLANLINEAALAAAEHRREQVTAADFGEALEKTLLGTVRGIVLSPEEKLSTAYHESGHALLGMLTPGADPVRRVTIIPRGQALGVTLQTPQMDRYGYSERYLRGRIVGALGGRAAEEIVYADVTTGAESDLQQATQVARQMVGRWGMSAAVGPVSVLPPPGQEQPFGGDGVAPATKELVDAEVRRLVEECYGEAVGTLRSNRKRLDRLAHTLLERETLGEDDAYAAAGVTREMAPAAVARGEAPGTGRAPGLPPEDAAALTR